MPIYEYKEKKGEFSFSNNTIIRIDNKDEFLAKHIDKITINQKSNKYKILLIKSEKDLLKFDEMYGFNPIDTKTGEMENRKIKWDLVIKRYGGMAIDYKKLGDYIDSVWFDYLLFGWLDEHWYTNYGFVWRFKLE